jgi:hypothetical protein
MEKKRKAPGQARINDGTRSAVIDPDLARKILRLLRVHAKLPRSGNTRHILAELEMKFVDTPELRAYVGLAQRKHSGDEGDVEVDSDAAVSVGEHGAYIQAWTFVSKEDLSQNRSLSIPNATSWPQP